MPVIGQGVEICTSTTRPTNPVVGTIIYETDTASYRWCTAVSPSITWLGMTPTGTVESFAGSSAPTGWLLCHGQSLNATSNPQYADLWGVLGTTYGGSGITAFNVPDLRGRSVAGKDNMGGSTASRITATSGITGTTLGATGGDERVQNHTHTFSGTTGNDSPDHSHQMQGQFTGVAPGGGSALGFGGAFYGTNTSGRNQFHQHGFSGTTANHNQTAGGASQNMPPTIILNYIIKI